jgi:hypothetical protein
MRLHEQHWAGATRTTRSLKLCGVLALSFVLNVCASFPQRRRLAATCPLQVRSDSCDLSIYTFQAEQVAT